MPSFYLQSIDEDGATTTKSFESCYLNDTIEYVSDFLSGCGFCFEEIKVVNKQFDVSEDEINDLRDLLAELDYNSMKDSIKSINEKVNYFFE